MTAGGTSRPKWWYPCSLAIRYIRNYLLRVSFCDLIFYDLEANHSFQILTQKYEYYCDHVYAPDCDSMTWSLDYDKLSDFDDVAGHWHLEEHPKKPVGTNFHQQIFLVPFQLAQPH